MNNIIILIPSFNPNEKIMSKFINELRTVFNNIIIVNDGSKSIHSTFFNNFTKQGITVLNHYTNLGKGAAIKTGFNYILNTYPNIKGVVTADCDGQHSVNSIKNCANSILQNPDCLILGTRNFKRTNIPFKSRYGNKITRTIFKFFIGLNISDTQTGLRGFNKKLIIKFLSTKGTRFEYESNMLIDCKIHNIKIVEVPIDTIYIDNNIQTSFNPWKDSISIYKIFAKYIFSSISSSILDILLFAIFISILNKFSIVYTIVFATILSRTISSFYNFSINAKMVFKKTNNKSLIKYFILVIFQMVLSGSLVTYIYNFSTILPLIIIKIIVDCFIFILNFILQREWVFKN